MSHRVTLIPGDGIGPEVTEAAKAVIAAAGVDIAWETVEARAAAAVKYGKPLPDAVRKVILEGKHVTRDLGGSAGTHAYAEALIKALVREGSVVCPMTPPFSRSASCFISNRRREFPSPSYRRA